MPSINISNLQIEEIVPQMTAKLEFVNVIASPYCVKDDDSLRINAGLTIPFNGGKFSCPMPPEVAEQLQTALKGRQVKFSRIVMLVTPATIGRDKKGALKPIKLLSLYQGKDPIYTSDH